MKEENIGKQFFVGKRKSNKERNKNKVYNLF